ncbi:RsmB/NOP family class I SAM-dependent RNA methyltransferase [Magnetovibrio sp. PR-2]|uniref:RsmB/NOP family class I SAM-dependent RNA methyltransferase n=1 Tax=Magnetovibrio sp. PR-2 TaxID=3120356 RepID=UPI002FCDEAAB
MARGKKTAGGNKGNKRKVYLQRLSRIFGVREAAAQDMASVQLKSSLRLNVLSPLSEPEILDKLTDLGVDITPIDWCPQGYHLHSDKRAISESDLFQDGHVYIQNASSLIPALALDPQAGDRILDVCAAPGGKTTHIQALAGGRATIVANDAMKPRLKKLEEVLTTFHVNHATITNFEGQFIDRHLEHLGGELFDRILLDAQCSGEGMEDLSHPGALRFWSEERVIKMSYLQQKMLTSAWKLLKPGGTLVYSTCTFGPEENEGPVSRHLKHHDDAHIEPINLDIPGRKSGLKSWGGTPFHTDLKHAVRVLPSPHLEGFFVCRLKKANI